MAEQEDTTGQTNGQPQEEVYDLALAEETIPIRGKDGEIRKYVMRELDGAGRDAFLNFQASKVRFGADGKPTGFRSQDGIRADLLSRCMFDEAGKAISSKEIQSWPARTQERLAMKALKMSGLDEEAKDREKND